MTAPAVLLALALPILAQDGADERALDEAQDWSQCEAPLPVEEAIVPEIPGFPAAPAVPEAGETERPGPDQGETPSSGGWRYPLDRAPYFRWGFGWRRLGREPHFHRGLDLGARLGDSVYASRPGVVAFAGWRAGYGNVVIVRHADGYRSLYAHLDRALVSSGEGVRGRVRIGLAGSTGISRGPHLHFEIWNPSLERVDPAPFLGLRTRVASAR